MSRTRVGAPVRTIGLVALGSTVGIGGATTGVFLLFLATSGMPTLLQSIPANVVGVVALTAAGGACWGSAVALAVDAPPWSGAKRGALAFTVTTLLMAFPIDAAQLALDRLPARLPGGVHGYYTAVFMAGVAAIGGLSSAGLVKRLGVAGHRRIGWLTAIGGAVGFLLGSLVAVGAGFVVNGFPHHMVGATVVAAPIAAAGAGLGMGFALARPTGTSIVAPPGGPGRGARGTG